MIKMLFSVGWEYRRENKGVEQNANGMKESYKRSSQHDKTTKPMKSLALLFKMIKV